ncbi:hypothetical protein LX64_00625 [Chitinophaga skermanii]|uniref:WYL domain-containing protein n=1 Tax=Chitinophaga skermanii TaxID=331697 RepID=A0A327R4M8_9BACT|nr:hypothetical protein [Chitinophaga skermanii]RAJ11018.1 hypothetical protein LX64_00625 [Chitinophaga skermanii]
MPDTLSIIKEAIVKRKPIQYEYNCPGKIPGKRTGHPHILYTAKHGQTNVDIYKLGGVCTDPSKPLPAWRDYIIDYITHVEIIDTAPSFEIERTFNHHAHKYVKVLLQV